MQNRLYMAETLLGVLIGITLFTLIWFTFSHWQQRQTAHINANYQRQQALQIIENQIALQLAGKPCETQTIQNGITFRVECTKGKIQVNFPLGQAVIFE
ncbi:DUF5374 domain-containing protein [Actinobacillus pleuropneumoniae]|uniref:DUF5374 domain-containing protein n=2 Tax=Actinobacillus pleuropneumoniae TaxID=715 RepID=A0A9Q4DJ94_ACTPL|nr:DUF5374 domain-containing protein [Actinobacillus pleuropneumoniae]MCL7721854.1 DUF5374 domain-containing protein [Actinobacillus pleuropneumoniae]MCL7728284.1 DUF5374 domain-containing protein [Actinobacillus pleuropneumoniae]MCL7729365.1 DUF5374 domain-containing protein [Actinobacillus pleuropneumoniae]MCY6368832.1 DUF5374 domain-containing protein [Actinobacillus pleuropneumoniae]MCY6385705.1 DUF5374 domain-containing protein [Actinobacillus pleuropneumoniae]